MSKERAAALRALDFMLRDAAKWRKEKQCATCHHGTFTLWTLLEAKSRGYAIAADTLADTAKWTKDRFMKDIDKPRDTRPGWKMVNTPAIYLSLMAQAVPDQKAITADDLKRIAGHLLRHQETDGSWAWSSAPAKNRPPPFFESDEVATLLVLLALAPQVPADANEKSAVRDARANAADWMNKQKPSDTTQAAALRLLVKMQAGEPAKVEIDGFLARQDKDGGWSQVPGLASDAYATGQALYALDLAGVKSDRPEIRRGVAFLVASQRDNGSWPISSRGHPGVKAMTNPVPITYFGSAWATLGLLRSVPR